MFPLTNAHFIDEVIPDVRNNLAAYWGHPFHLGQSLEITDRHTIRTGHFNYENYFRNSILPNFQVNDSLTIVAITGFSLGTQGPQAVRVGTKMHCMVDGNILKDNEQTLPVPQLVDRISLVTNHELVHALGDHAHEFCQRVDCFLGQWRAEDMVPDIDRKLPFECCPECARKVQIIKNTQLLCR